MNITNEEFNEIRDIMYKRTGVFLKPTKKPLVVSRLRTRLEELNLNSFRSYIALLNDLQGQELEIFVNAITTNETFFFRHPGQFNFLMENIFPDIANTKQNHPEIRMWSAACSTGEEPYSLAIAAMEFLKKHPGLQFKIYASDINSDVIAKAKHAQYSERSLKEVPSSVRERYFKPVPGEGTKRESEFELDIKVRDTVEFRQHNLLKSFAYKNLDIIFIRSVMIYFTREIKQKIINLLQKNLLPGGYLFISLSEHLSDIDMNLKLVQNGIYQKI